MFPDQASIDPLQAMRSRAAFPEALHMLLAAYVHRPGRRRHSRVVTAARLKLGNVTQIREEIYDIASHLEPTEALREE